MFASSRFPTRLLLRCPTCFEYASVTIAEYAARQTFCRIDGVPMTVLGVAAGHPPKDGETDWPLLINGQTPIRTRGVGAAVTVCPCAESEPAMA